jgi:hypothetical protein
VIVYGRNAVREACAGCARSARCGDREGAQPRLKAGARVVDAAEVEARCRSEVHQGVRRAGPYAYAEPAAPPEGLAARRAGRGD